MTFGLKPSTARRAMDFHEAIVFFFNEHGYPPTVAEIAEIVGVASKSYVVYYLQILAALGLISRKERADRGIEVLEEHFSAPISGGREIFYTTARIKGKETRVRIWIP